MRFVIIMNEALNYLLARVGNVEIVWRMKWYISTIGLNLCLNSLVKITMHI